MIDLYLPISMLFGGFTLYICGYTRGQLSRDPDMQKLRDSRDEALHVAETALEASAKWEKLYEEKP